MNTQNKIIGVIIVLVVAGASFWGGITYANSNRPSRGQFGQGGMGGMTRGMRGAGFAAGEIIAKDATGVTIKLQDGSTKIILAGPSTQILKSASGTTDDLAVGTAVLVNGTANADGSISAQSVQIRPAGAPAFGARRTMGQ